MSGPSSPAPIPHEHHDLDPGRFGKTPFAAAVRTHSLPRGGKRNRLGNRSAALSTDLDRRGTRRHLGGAGRGAEVR